MAEEMEERTLMRLLDLLLRLAERHRFYISLLLMTSSDEKTDVPRLVRSALRRSDIVFESSDCCTVLMAHTSKEDAARALARFQRWCDDSMGLCFATATYPCDGATVESLMLAGETRLKAARQVGFNAVSHVGPRYVEPTYKGVPTDNGAHGWAP